MDWNTFCYDVVQGECHLIHYAFIGTPAAVWGEFCMTSSFTGLKTAEIVTIINSNGASFPFRDQVYQLVENNKGIFYYESSTSSLSYAATCNCSIPDCVGPQTCLHRVQKSDESRNSVS
ncbi:unnamed protein product [Clavelina lepadiformis]|uniref:SWIM-type domain-containing protein n=1 Tax=Clavelina lepadiformis TaxID=159417 RepID=A0ABP0GWM2_CLALP